MQGLIFTFQEGTDRLSADDPTRAMMAAALVRADDLLAQSRDHVSGLRRSAGDDSLVDLLRGVAADLQTATLPTITLVVDGGERIVCADARQELLRISGEALLNAIRHASASSIAITVSFDVDVFVLLVVDDGVGFDALRRPDELRTTHFGLIGMHERAARFGGSVVVLSVVGSGTTVRCEMPADRAYGTRRTTRWSAPWREATSKLRPRTAHHSKGLR